MDGERDAEEVILPTGIHCPDGGAFAFATPGTFLNWNVIPYHRRLFLTFTSMMLGNASNSFTHLDLHNADHQHSISDVSNTEHPTPAKYHFGGQRVTREEPKDLGHARLSFRKYKARTTGRCSLLLTQPHHPHHHHLTTSKTRHLVCIATSQDCHHDRPQWSCCGHWDVFQTSTLSPERAVQAKNTSTFHRMPGYWSKANGQTYLGLCPTAISLTPLHRWQKQRSI